MVDVAHPMPEGVNQLPALVAAELTTNGRLGVLKKDRDRELVLDHQLTQSSDDVGYFL